MSSFSFKNTHRSYPKTSSRIHAWIFVFLCLWFTLDKNDALLPLITALDNGLGRVPPIGWNSWNQFHCQVDEELILSTADRIIELEMDQVGYRYVNIDDCWMAHHRNETTGKLEGNPETFPHGMKYIGDYLHNRSLMFGIYSSAGTLTCAGYPASLGNESTDAKTFADDWGVDYLKYDNCHNLGLPSIDRYTVMRDALNATGRPIFYSLCQWGTEDSWQWAPAVGNSWRTTGDIEPNWGSIRSVFWQSQRHFERGGPGGWLDPDMLEVGNGKLTLDESKSHFALWALAKAPLLLGNDLHVVQKNDPLWTVITNRHLIALHQDENVKQATCYIGCRNRNDIGNKATDWSVLATHVPSTGDSIVIVVNWSHASVTNLTFAGQAVGVVPMPGEVVTVTDLWTDTIVGEFDNESLKTIPVVPAIFAPHSCALYRLSSSNSSKQLQSQQQDHAPHPTDLATAL